MLINLNDLVFLGTKSMSCIEDAPKSMISKKRRYETDEAK